MFDRVIFLFFFQKIGQMSTTKRTTGLTKNQTRAILTLEKRMFRARLQMNQRKNRYAVIDEKPNPIDPHWETEPAEQVMKAHPTSTDPTMSDELDLLASLDRPTILPVSTVSLRGARGRGRGRGRL